MQEQFLNTLRRDKTPVTVFLLNGIKLQGILTGADETALLLQRESHMQLVYKHAISTIMPNTTVVFAETDNGPA